MALTTSGLDYIAQNFGIGNCWVGSGLSWVSVDHDGNRLSESGGTKSIVGRLISDMVYASIEMTSPRTGTYTKSQLISANGGQSITLSDVNNADPNYCVGAAPPPTQKCTPNALHCYGGDVYRCSSDGMSRSKVEDCPAGCTNGVCDAVVGGCTLGSRRCNGNRIEECRAVAGQDNAWFDIGVVCEHGCTNGVCNPAPGEPGEVITETGPFEVTVGGSEKCPAGAPTVTLDTSEAFAYFKAEPARYVGVMEIMVKHIHDSCYAYFAWEMRDGSGYATCPTTSPEHQEISRFLAKVSPKKVITLKRIDANVTEMVSGSFEIPAHIEGRKTICLSLWGDYDYNKLVSDLAAEGYEKEIDW